MGHHYQPDFDKVIKGQSIETSEAEILAAVRKILTSEAEIDSQMDRDGEAEIRQISPASQVIKRSLGAILPGRFRA